MTDLTKEKQGYAMARKKRVLRDRDRDMKAELRVLPDQL